MNDYLFVCVLLVFRCFLIARFLISTEVVFLQRCLVVAWLVPREAAAVSAHSVYTIQQCTMSRYFMQTTYMGVVSSDGATG